MNVISSDDVIIPDQKDEVKKLQDLVKKLEEQNKELRKKRDVNEENEQKRAAATKNSQNNCCDERNSSDKLISKPTSDNGLDEKPTGLYLESVDIIDIDELEDLSDEDSWLFSPPRELTPEQRKLSPYKWIRKDVDNPAADDAVHSVRRALVNKLDEIIRVSPFATQVNSPINAGRLANDHSNTAEKEAENVPSSQKPSDSVNDESSAPRKFNAEYPQNSLLNPKHPQRFVDTRTFKRPRKRELFFKEPMSGPKESAEYDSEGSIERLQDEIVPEEFNDLCSLESSMTASGLYKFHGVEEVQQRARMQQESLKESSPIPSPKHNSGSSSHEHISYHVTEEGLFINHVDVGEHAQNSKAYTDEVDEDSDSFDQSNGSSPREMSANRTYNSRKPTQGCLRRSLPNLRKGYAMPEQSNGARHTSESHPLSRGGGVNDNYSTYRKSQLTAFSRRGSSPGGGATYKKSASISNEDNERYVDRRMYASPSRKSPSADNLARDASPNVVTPRSNLPRPGSRLPTPKSRSQLPMPSSSRLPHRAPQNQRQNF